MSGWIKLHRQIVNSSKFADPDILRLWILCLTKAAHKETVAVIDRQEIPLLPGQFVTGRFSLDSDYNAGLAPRKKIKDTTLWNWLQRLEKWGDLDIKSTNKYSVVTVLKWCEYQESLTTEPQQIDNRLTTEPQQFDTNKNVKKEKNDKKDKEVKKAYSENVHLTESEYQRLIDEHGKELTDRSIEYLSSYKLEKNYKTKSDNLTIRRWVIDAAKKVTVMPITKKEGENNVEYGGRNQGIKTNGNASAGPRTEQRESKVYKGRWDDVEVSLPSVQG